MGLALFFVDLRYKKIHRGLQDSMGSFQTQEQLKFAYLSKDSIIDFWSITRVPL